MHIWTKELIRPFTKDQVVHWQTAEMWERFLTSIVMQIIAMMRYLPFQLTGNSQGFGEAVRPGRACTCPLFWWEGEGASGQHL